MSRRPIHNRDLTSAIMTVADARSFIKLCVDVLGQGFHPDTRGKDYINLETGEHVFDIAEGWLFDERMEEAFGVLEDPYAVAIEFIEKELTK